MMSGNKNSPLLKRGLFDFLIGRHRLKRFYITVFLLPAPCFPSPAFLFPVFLSPNPCSLSRYPFLRNLPVRVTPRLLGLASQIASATGAHSSAAATHLLQ